MKNPNNETILRKPAKNRWLKLTAGAAVAVGAAIGIALTADQWGHDSDSGTALKLQNTLSALRSFEAADYLHLSIKLSGSLVSGNATQSIDIYVNDVTSNPANLDVDDALTADVLSNLNAFVSYVGVHDKAQYNISVVNERGFYTIQNTTSGEIMDVSCVTQDSVPPLESIVHSLLDSDVMAPDASVLLGLSRFCPVYEVRRENGRATSCVCGGGKHCNYYDYLSTEEIKDDVIVKRLTTIPEVPDFLNVNATKKCPTLDFSQHNSELRSMMPLQGVPSRLLSEKKERKLKWYESKWGRVRSDAPIGKRHLFTSYDFTVTTTSAEFDTFQSFASDVLGCVYFCAPSEFGNEQIPLNEVSNYVTFSDTSFRKLSEESYTYLECVKDPNADPIFSVKKTFSSQNGPEMCSEHCQGYKYFGLKRGNECWCGNNDDYAIHNTFEDYKCAMDCTDGSGVKCGNTYKMSVYKYDEVEAPAATSTSLGHHITLPRPCVLAHGPGLGWASDRFEREAEEAARGSSVNFYLDPSLHNYFGYVEQSRPCYCSSMLFVVTNTEAREWYEQQLQIIVCRSIAMASNPIERVTKSSDSSKSLAISNTVVITHHTASLTLGAALAKGYCSFDSSSKWATIHTPVGQSFYEAAAEGDSTGSGVTILLCNQENVKALHDKYQEFDAGTSGYSNLDSFMTQSLPGGVGTFQDVFDACSAHSTVERFVSHQLYHRYPEDMQELYEQAQAQMVQHVSGAMCGHGEFGLLSTKSLINQISADLISPSEVSDGATPLQSCLKLADLQGEEVTFSDDPSDPYYVAASHYTDVHDFRDSWVGDAAQIREWVDKLRLHTDL